MRISGRLAGSPTTARAGITAACALGLVASACGGGGSSRPAAFTSSTTITPPSAADLAHVQDAARATLATTARIGFTLAATSVMGSAAPISGQGSFDLGGSRGQALLQQPTGPERMVFLPASVYVAQGGGSTLLPPGHSWLSAGLTEDSVATNFPQFVTQAESLNPALMLSEIAWGAVTAGPTASRQYAVQVDLAQAEAKAEGPSGPAFKRAIGYQLTQMSGGNETQVAMDVEIDGSGKIDLVRSSPPGAGMGTITLALSHYGSPVQVSEPARAQVVDIAKLAPGGERENAGGGDSDGA